MVARRIIIGVVVGAHCCCWFRYILAMVESECFDYINNFCDRGNVVVSFDMLVHMTMTMGEDALIMDERSVHVDGKLVDVVHRQNTVRL